MKRHSTYQAQLAANEPLTSSAQATLIKHVARCLKCQERSRAFDEQRSIMRSVKRELPPAEVREALMAAAANARPKRTVRSYVSKKRAGGGLLAVAVLGAITVNTPLPRAVAEVVGISSPQASIASRGMTCSPAGYGIPKNYQILRSPDDYHVGPHGTFLHFAEAMAEHDLKDPTWFVVPNDGEGITLSTCSNSVPATEDVRVAFNPDTHTELHVVGLQQSQTAP